MAYTMTVTNAFEAEMNGVVVFDNMVDAVRAGMAALECAYGADVEITDAHGHPVWLDDVEELTLGE